MPRALTVAIATLATTFLMLGSAGAAGAAPRAHPSVTTAATAAVPATPVLSRGSTGAAVLAAQQRLSALGYWLGTPTGRYDELTRQAVMALQGAAGLHRDGVLGPATRRSLEAGVLPQVVTPTGRATEIDRAAGLVVFTRDGRVRAVLHTSTGSSARYTSPSGAHEVADTPAGTFHVQRAVDGWRTAELGRLYRPRYVESSQGIAVHGYRSVPAYPASHGCARVSMAAMDMIWARDLMPVGGLVVVR